MIDKTRQNPILGMGIGDRIMRTLLRPGLAHYVDNSYVYVYWKMGLLGLFSFLLVWFLFLKRCIFVLKHKIDEKSRLIVISSLAIFIGLALIALTNACLALYRFNIIWALTIGSVEIIARRVENETKMVTKTS